MLASHCYGWFTNGDNRVLNSVVSQHGEDDYLSLLVERQFTSWRRFGYYRYEQWLLSPLTTHEEEMAIGTAMAQHIDERNKNTPWREHERG